MKSGMAFFHCNENSAACRANFSTAAKSSFDRRAIIGRLDHTRGKMNVTVRRCRSQKLDVIFGGHRARNSVRLRPLHQMIGRGPIAVAIQQRANDSAIQNARKSLVFFLRRPIGDDFIAMGETHDVKPLGIRRSTPETCVLRRVMFLQ